FRDAATETDESDGLLLDRAISGINALNEKYAGTREGDVEPTVGVPPAQNGDGADQPRAGGDGAGRFFLFHRARRWNPREGVWMGWERKRGKLEEFNAALRGDDSGFETVVGPMDCLTGVRYVITLDS